MSIEVYYRFFQNTRLLGEGTVQAPFTVGRQTEPDSASPVSVLDVPPNSKHYVTNESVARKLVIVPLSNRAVPRLSLRIDVDKNGNILARNVHRAVELYLPSREALRPNQQLLLGLEGTICFPDEYQLRLSFQQPTVRFGAELGQPVRAEPTPNASRAPAVVTALNGTAKVEFFAEAASPSLPPSVAHRSDPAVHAERKLADDSDARQSPVHDLEISVDDSVRAHRSPQPAADARGSYIAVERLPVDVDNPGGGTLALMGAVDGANQQELAVRLVHTALEAFKLPPGSQEFFEAAARAALQMIDLDRVAVLRKEQDTWVCRTLVFRPGMAQTRSAARHFSHGLLEEMERNRRTTSVDPQFDFANVSQALQNIDRAVAAPIFDESKQIVAALYGDRFLGESENKAPIGELEAALLEVLASGISSSLALKQEQRLRSSMVQFFSPVVLDQLRRDRSLLDGRVADVSVLFCDIRGFSTISERIGPSQSIAWINDILTTLSECVLAHDGVLVDYIGDELMAMWGAPGEQPDHAARACRAAMDMMNQVVPLGEKWRSIVPSHFGLGIGINSGQASVGNTGSAQKFKYGPLGNTVNIASRIQGITKQLGVSSIVSGESAELACRSGQFPTRRLAKVRVVGIAQPLDVFELCQQATQGELSPRYEAALTSYEAGELQVAAGRLASIVQDFPDDRPTIVLLSRTVEMLTQPDRQFDPVWNLAHK